MCSLLIYQLQYLKGILVIFRCRNIYKHPAYVRAIRTLLYLRIQKRDRSRRLKAVIYFCHCRWKCYTFQRSTPPEGSRPDTGNSFRNYYCSKGTVIVAAGIRNFRNSPSKYNRCKLFVIIKSTSSYFLYIIRNHNFGKA